MSDKKNMSKKARRNLLKSAVAGSGAMLVGKTLPDSWSRPVVDSVMLPAHAQTSGVFAGAGGGIVKLDQSNNLLARLAETLVPKAQAGFEEGVEVDVRYCFTVNAEQTLVDAGLIIAVNQVQINCNFNRLFNVPAIPVGGKPVDVFQADQEGCDSMKVRKEDVLNPSSSWLAKAGLINDADAGPAVFLEEIPDLTIQITAVDGTVRGILYYLGFEDNFIIGQGACDTYSPICSDGCKNLV